MALNWEHIKGYNGDSTTGGQLPLYTFIEYQKGPAMGPTPPVISSLTDNYLPDIVLGYTNVQGAPTAGYFNCGHIVTNNIDTQFNKNLIFKTGVGIKFATDSDSASPWDYDNAFHIYGSHDSTRPNNNIVYMDIPSSSIFEISDITTDNVLLQLTNTLLDIQQLNVNFAQNVAIAGTLTSSNTITTTSYVQASYFNATSDRRAKDSIMPISDSMLDIVKKIQVYTFNYKSNPSQRNIGLIAQDLKDINIDGFSLVTNPDATGKDGDYMAIHESKLVYILLEAVKELSAEVDALKDKLGE